jgi:hypothetical protein
MEPPAIVDVPQAPSPEAAITAFGRHLERTELPAPPIPEGVASRAPLLTADPAVVPTVAFWADPAVAPTAAFWEEQTA